MIGQGKKNQLAHVINLQQLIVLAMSNWHLPSIQDIMIPFRLPILATLFVSGTAFAQTSEPFQAEPSGPLLRSNVAGSRQQPGQEAVGISVGDFLVQPSLTTRLEGDSNVLNRSSNKRGDLFIVIAPAIQAASGTEQANYVLKAQAAFARFASITSQNSETFGIEANGRMMLSKKTSVFARVAFDRRIEPRGQAGESIFEGSPAEYDQIEAQIATRAEFSALRLTAAATATKRDYKDIVQEDGKTKDQQFRASNVLAFGLKAEYALPTGTTLIASGAFNHANSPNAELCCDRSSDGGQLNAGIRTEITQLISTEVTAGYVFRDYKSKIYKDFNGATWQAKLDWYPTPLMSLSFSAGRKIVSSGMPAVAGVVVDSAGFQLFYELRRDLNLVFTLSKYEEDYREINTKSSATLTGIEGRYIMSPRIALGIYSRLRDRRSTNPSQLQGGNGLEGGLWLRAAL
jgi:hypothetical protein